MKEATARDGNGDSTRSFTHSFTGFFTRPFTRLFTVLFTVPRRKTHDHGSGVNQHLDPMTRAPILPAPRTEVELDELLSRPDEGAVRALAGHPGDVMVLGVGGKMGPTLARMLRRAADDADGTRDLHRVIGVSRFS